MATDTAVVENETSKVFDVPTEQKRLEDLRNQIQAKYTEIAAAVNSNDFAATAVIGKALGELTLSADRLERKIKRTVEGVTTDSSEKIASRDVVFNLLRSMITENVNGLSDSLNAFRSINPSLQQVRIVNMDDGTWGFESVGGIRVVTKTGIKRARTYYTGEGLTADKDAAGNDLPGSKPATVYGLFGKKYKAPANWADATATQRNEVLSAIVEGQHLTKVTK